MKLNSSAVCLRASTFLIFGLLTVPGSLLAGPIGIPSIASASTVQATGYPAESAPLVGTIDGSPATTSISRTYTSLGSYSLGLQSGMSIDNGSWRSIAGVSGFMNAQGIGAAVSRSTAVGDVFDNITIANGSYFILPVHISGSVTADITAPSGFTGTLVSSVTVGYGCQVNSFNGSNYLPGSSCTGTQLNFNGSQQVDTVVELTIPFTAGLIFTLHLSPSVQASAGYTANGELPFIPGQLTFNAQGDFMHTAILQAIRIYDAQGNLLNGVSVQSDSGFNYLAGAGVPDPGPGGSVPEPSTLLLLGGGLGLVGLLRRKR